MNRKDLIVELEKSTQLKRGEIVKVIDELFSVVEKEVDSGNPVVIKKGCRFIPREITRKDGTSAKRVLFKTSNS